MMSRPSAPSASALGDYRRLDERSRSAYDLERLRHAHGFGPIRSLYADVHRTLERLVVSNELRGPGRVTARRWTATRGTGRRRSSAISAATTSGAAASATPQELTADGHEYLPVVYVNVDALPTIKGLNHAILTFYGMGPPQARERAPADAAGARVRAGPVGRR